MPGEEKLYIKKIKLSDGSIRWVKDDEARNAIEAEVERATNKDASLEADIVSNHDDIVAEANRAKAAELQNANAIIAEQTRAQGVEDDLQDQIDDIKADAAKIASGEKVLGKNANKELTTTLSISYDSTSRKIQLKGIDNALVSEFDASDFIKDGMLWGEQVFKATGTSHKVTITKGSVTQEHTFTGLIKDHQYLAFCFSNGAVPTPAYTWDIVDLQDLVDVYTAGNGINVTNNVITAVAKSGDKYIEVTSAGIASKGIDEAIKVETDRAEAAEKAINDKIGKETDQPGSDNTVYAEINGLDNRLTTEITNRGIDENALSNRIEVFEDNKSNYDDAVSKAHTHSNKAELDKIATGDKAKWDAKQDALVFDGTYNASTNKAATVSTVTTEAAKYLPLTAGESKPLTGTLKINDNAQGVSHGKILLGDSSIESDPTGLIILGNANQTDGVIIKSDNNAQATVKVNQNGVFIDSGSKSEESSTNIKGNLYIHTDEGDAFIGLGSDSNTEARFELENNKLTIAAKNGIELETTTTYQGKEIAVKDDIKITGIKLNGGTVTPDANKVVDLGSIATTAGVIGSINYNGTTHTLSAKDGTNTEKFTHTFGALADKDSVSGNATITHTATDITLNGTFTPTGTVSVTLKNAGVLASVATAGTLPTLGTESKSKFVKKTINAKIATDDDECLEFFEVANTDTNFYADAVTAQGTFSAGAMPTFNTGTVAVNSASFTGTADQAISTSGKYDKANTTAAVTAN